MRPFTTATGISRISQARRKFGQSSSSISKTQDGLARSNARIGIRPKSSG
jgi:hypothetical protein